MNMFDLLKLFAKSEVDFVLLDVLVKPVVPYVDLRKQATILDIGELKVAVAMIDHLIVMKTGAGRSKDQIDIEELCKIQANNE